MKNIRDIRYRGRIMQVCEANYSDESPALLVLDQGEEYMVATSWIPGIPEGCVAIKNYSENEGILDVFVEAGIVGAPIRIMGMHHICPYPHNYTAKIPS